MEGSLKIKVIEARGLKSKDDDGQQDPYAVLELGSQRFQTEVQMNEGTRPTFGQTFTFTVESSVRPRVKISIWDKDYYDSDLICQANFLVSELLKSEGPHWHMMRNEHGRHDGSQLRLECTFTGTTAEAETEAKTEAKTEVKTEAKAPATAWGAPPKGVWSSRPRVKNTHIPSAWGKPLATKSKTQDKSTDHKAKPKVRISVKPTREELKDFSAAVSKLWSLDLNRLRANIDYKINLQRGTKPYRTGDAAREPLFSHVAPNLFRDHPTFSAFHALMDNYERSTGVQEKVTNTEKKENRDFIRKCLNTAPMKYCHRYLAAKRLAPSHPNDFAKILDKLWFAFYRRESRNDSCGFEHVFVGEERNGKVMGMHNWVQLYLEEKAGRLDYKGYIPARDRRSPLPDDDDQVVTIQFAWQRETKPVSTSFIGVTPEFELALYTMAFLGGKEDNAATIIDGHNRYNLNIKCYSIGHGSGRKIGTAFPEQK